MQATLQVIFPFTQKWVKIVLPIPFRWSLLNFDFRWVILLRECWQELQDYSQSARHKTITNEFHVSHRLALLKTT